MRKVKSDVFRHKMIIKKAMIEQSCRRNITGDIEGKRHTDLSPQYRRTTTTAAVLFILNKGVQQFENEPRCKTMTGSGEKNQKMIFTAKQQFWIAVNHRTCYLAYNPRKYDIRQSDVEECRQDGKDDDGTDAALHVRPVLLNINPGIVEENLANL